MAYYDLGTYTRGISTSSPIAQTWFNRGLIWTYAYNHEEAIACFEHALEADANCAMAHWGIAYAIGPNYNKPWEAFEEDELPATLVRAREASVAAAQLATTVTAAERDLINAITARYPDSLDIAELNIGNDAYAHAMRAVYKIHCTDLDICCLFAEALMNRTPWALWELDSGQPATGANTLEAKKALDTCFEQDSKAWAHPGLLHMYIHLMEMSATPEQALRHGDALSTLVPDAGHLLHMPTHIDVLCGDYQKVVERNQTGIIADRKYLSREGAENFYSVYRCHNYHFKIYGAMFLGQPSVALDTANELISTMSEDFLRSLADWFEAFVPIKQHVLVRFGRWSDILEQEMPSDPKLYAVTTAMMRYARTIALANIKKLDAADSERALFESAYEDVPESRMLFNNTCRDILAVAKQMMLGEIEYHKGNYADAFKHLRNSVTLDDNLPYDEPWGWMQPARHALGALLIDQGQFEEAEAVYRADLGLDDTLNRANQHPANVWSLHGLHECLENRGESVEIKYVALELDKAMARAEVPIKASCYCRHV